MTSEQQAPADDEPAVPAPPPHPRNKPRLPPSPWLDCEACGWRHYPSRSTGGWGVGAVCTSCGTPLVRRDP